MSKKNKKMRGFYGDASQVDNFDWWTPVETTQEEPVDNSWIYQQQLENERIAREQAQAEADRIAREQAQAAEAYQRYLVELEAEIQRQQAIEAERQAEAARAYQRYLNQLEAERLEAVRRAE